MLIFHYETKKALRECIGKRLLYSETSIFGPEYQRSGTNTGTNHPKRSWFANVTCKDGVITKVK